MKQLFLCLTFTFVNFFSAQSFAASEPDWSEGYAVPRGGRNNPYQLSAPEFAASRERGRQAAIEYPVNVSGILLPFYPVYNFIEKPTDNPLSQILKFLFASFTDIKTFNEFLSWIGLHAYPKESDHGIYSVPYPHGVRPKYLMGFSPIERGGATGFTVGCVACHSANLFGKSVLGMSNRFPRANRLFFNAKQAAPFANLDFFQVSTGANAAETHMMGDDLKNLQNIGSTLPQQLGLDTSLSHVAIALNHRAPDAWATPDPDFQKYPRADRLDSAVADSKPAVWWNLKYKNRWLSDGSVVSGNPVFTNILWNEIGRGLDLHILDQWLNQNQQVIQDLVTAIFSSEAPPITDFFDVAKIDIAKAKRGEIIFNQACKDCHGEYVKNWSVDTSAPPAKLIQTFEVIYHSRTPLAYVGTDAHRWQGMASLEQLNRLTISKVNGTLIRPQKAYVPPPLVGIWARWPYFHNNSVPSLCALLTAGPLRPKIFYAREANDPIHDFDFNCNGYPLGTSQDSSLEYDTSRAGLSNLGHDQGIFLDGDHERFTSSQKSDLIQFLQTL